jgi:tetratricopeptide (TPR) repeat protein
VGGLGVDDLFGYLLVLDAGEKQINPLIKQAGLREAEVYYPMFPEQGPAKRTVWWPSAARLFDQAIQMEKRKHRPFCFYWGAAHYLKAFLQHVMKWNNEEALVWSQWEHKKHKGVTVFQGALGVCLPIGAEDPGIPYYVGNRFFRQAVISALEQAGVPIRCAGRPWPTPQEELNRCKGDAFVTLGLIAKDEEEFLAGCLEQALPYVDRIVLVDTGSQDHTVEIAKAYGADIIFHPWEDDFSAARNSYLACIGAGWVLSLDADECLTPEAGVCLRTRAEQNSHKVIYLQTYNYSSEEIAAFSDQANIRLYWLQPGDAYSGKIHEQLVTSLPRELVVGPRVMHYGYLPALLKKRGKFRRNAVVLTDVVKSKCQNAFDWYNHGLTLLGLNEFEKALAALQMYFSLETPEFTRYRPSAYWHAARAALGCGKKEKALEYAEQACQVPLPECYYTKAQVLEALGRVDEAIEVYKEAAGLPEAAAYYYQVFNQSDTTIRMWKATLAAAVLLERRGRLLEAEQQYSKVLQWDADNLVALMGLVRISRTQGNAYQERKFAERAVTAHPAVFSAHLAYVEALLAGNDWDKAWEHIGAACLPPEQTYRLLVGLANYFALRRDYLRSLKAAEKACGLVGSNQAAILLQVNALQELGRLEEAEKLLEGAPFTPEFENARGCLALARQRLTVAEEHFRAALEYSPSLVSAAVNLAKVLVLQSKVREALAVVLPHATGEGGNTRDLSAALMAGRCLNSLKQHDKVLTVLDGVDTERLSPENALELNLIKGNAFYGLGEWRAAADAYFSAYKVKPQDPELLFRIGLLMLRLQHWEDAENAFREVLQHEPSHQRARDLLEMAQRMQTIGSTLVQG